MTIGSVLVGVLTTGSQNINIHLRAKHRIWQQAHWRDVPVILASFTNRDVLIGRDEDYDQFLVIDMIIFIIPEKLHEYGWTHEETAYHIGMDNIRIFSVNAVAKQTIAFRRNPIQ